MGEITVLGLCEPVQSNSGEPLPVAGLFCVISSTYNVLLLFFTVNSVSKCLHQLKPG